MDTKESRELDTLETLLTCERKEVPKLEGMSIPTELRKCAKIPRHK